MNIKKLIKEELEINQIQRILNIDDNEIIKTENNGHLLTIYLKFFHGTHNLFKKLESIKSFNSMAFDGKNFMLRFDV